MSPREVSEREQPAKAWEEGALWASARKVATKVMGTESATGGGHVPMRCMAGGLSETRGMGQKASLTHTDANHSLPTAS